VKGELALAREAGACGDPSGALTVLLQELLRLSAEAGWQPPLPATGSGVSL